MYQASTKEQLFREPSRARLIYGIAVLWAIVVAFAGVWWLAEYGFESRDSKFYLLPWCVAAGIVIAAPSAYLIYQRRFDPFHPIVFAGWSYFLPGFVVGGLLLASGYAQPYFLVYVLDESHTLPLTLFYATVAYACLALGFSIPFFGRFGRWLGNKLPAWEPRSGSIPLPAVVLLCLGASGTVISFLVGLFGYQHTDEVPVYSGLLFLVTLLWIEGSFLLWLYAFRIRAFAARIIIISGLIVFAIARAIFAANRASLMQSVLLAGFAYVLARGKLSGKQYSVGAVLLILALFIGMIYGTTFRNLKGSQERVSTADYTTAISDTFTDVSDRDVSSMFFDVLDGLANRMDAASSLAVVVSNYEVLAPAEERWGISNNIVVDTVSFLIPRVIWSDKPTGIPAEKYAELYFNYSENAFTMTPMGDLLRNFGPWGIPVGMLLLGGVLRLLYASLIEGRSFSFWRATVYFMMLTSISYEGTYGLILPFLVRAGAAAFLGILILRLLALFTPGKLSGE